MKMTGDKEFGFATKCEIFWQNYFLKYMCLRLEKTATNDRQSRFCCNLCHSPFQTDLPLKRHQIPKTCDSNGRITFIHFLSSFWELEKGNFDLLLLTLWLLNCHIIAKMTRKHDGFIWTSPVKQN